MVLFNIGPETPTTEYHLFDSVGKPRQKPREERLQEGEAEGGAEEVAEEEESSPSVS